MRAPDQSRHFLQRTTLIPISSSEAAWTWAMLSGCLRSPAHLKPLSLSAQQKRGEAREEACACGMQRGEGEGDIAGDCRGGRLS